MAVRKPVPHPLAGLAQPFGGLWPPDYRAVAAWRQKQVLAFRDETPVEGHDLTLGQVRLAGAMEWYRTRPVEFISHWCDTVDPRNASIPGMMVRMPFVLFGAQERMIEFVQDCLAGEASGLIEKSRDIGATWVCVALSIWLWLFVPGISIGWGSKERDLVDKLGDPDSIFEKMRLLIRGLPSEFRPRGLDPSSHMTYMRFVNPVNGATITGDSGDNIGRGGRKRIFFKDESAHYEHPLMIEAALSENTRVQIDMSSVNGTGNPFHTRRESGADWRPGAPIVRDRTNVLVIDWSDHPDKTPEWYAVKKRKATNDGTLVQFAQEVDRNYAAAVEGVIINPEWVLAAVDAHKKLGFDDSGMWLASLDVADGGRDTNALARRKGVVLKHLDEWGGIDTTLTARRAVAACAQHVPLSLYYDAAGLGAGVKGETNSLLRERTDSGDVVMPRGLVVLAWSGGDAPVNKDGRLIPGDRNSPINGDFFQNLKAQAWWQLARRFERTWRAVTDPKFTAWTADDLISLDSDTIAPDLLRKLRKELSQPTYVQSQRLKMMVDKVPDGARSPNLADSVMMVYWTPHTLRPVIFSKQTLARLAGMRAMRPGRRAMA